MPAADSPVYLDRASVLLLLTEARAGRSLEETAREIGVSTQYLSLVLLGKRTIGRKVETYLGVRKVLVYERIPRL